MNIEKISQGKKKKRNVSKPQVAGRYIQRGIYKGMKRISLNTTR